MGNCHTQTQPKRYDSGLLYDAGHLYDSFTAFKPCRLVFRVYNSTGATFQGLLDNDVVGEIKFEKSINGGLGELIIRTKKPIDDFGQGSLINFRNIIKVYLTDGYANDRLIYQGYISAYNPFFDTRGEGTEITILSGIAKLNIDYFRLGTTTKITKSSMDPSEIIKDIIDNYDLAAGNDPLISYSGDSIDLTGNTISYTFDQKKHLEAIIRTAEFFPANWYWYLPADGNMKVKAKPNTATHTLFIGKHIKKIQTHKNIESIINKIIFWNGRQSNDPLYLLLDYNDATSQASYGINTMIVRDGRVTLAATANNLANKIIQERKDPTTIVDLEISDYDILGIEPGDTVNIRNIDITNQTTFPDNLTISKIKYNGHHKAEITLEEGKPDINEFVDEIELELDRITLDTNDQIIALPNVNIDTKARAHTVIVGSGYEYEDIQEGIDAVAALGGGIVFIKSGIYTLTGNITLSDNIILRGEDPNLTIIDGNSVGRIIGTGSDPYTQGTVNVTNGSKIITGGGALPPNWEGAGVAAGDIFKVDSDGQEYVIESIDSPTQITLKTSYQGTTLIGEPYTIYRDIHDIAVLNLQIINALGAGIALEDSRRFIIDNCIVSNSSNRGIQILDVNDCVIINNIVQNNAGSAGIAHGGASGRNIRITKNKCMYNSGDGISVGERVIVEGNDCNNNSDDGIHIGGDRNVISMNDCSGNTGYGLNMPAGSDNNMYSSNQLAGNTAGAINDAGTGNVSGGNVTS